MKKLLQSNPLFTIFVIPIIVDVVGTVLGQPTEFWTSGHKVFNEAIPIYPILQYSPILFIIFCLGFWLPITYLLTQKLKKPFNVWASMALLIGHGYNSVSWLRINLYQRGFLVINNQYQLSQALSLIPMTLYIILIGWFAMQGIMKYFQSRHD